MPGKYSRSPVEPNRRQTVPGQGKHRGVDAGGGADMDFGHAELELKKLRAGR